MAYSVIPITGVSSIVQGIATFAQTVGYTVHRNESGGTDPLDERNTYIVTLSYGSGSYITLLADLDQDYIYFNMHRGNNNSSYWNEQADQYHNASILVSRCFTKIPVTPAINMYCFGNTTPSPHLYFAIELDVGYYRHITIGEMLMYGTLTGGTFVDFSDTSYSGNYISYSAFNKYPLVYDSSVQGNYQGCIDTIDQNGDPVWVSLGKSITPGFNGTTYGGWWGEELGTTYKYGVNTFNSRTTLHTPFVTQRLTNGAADTGNFEPVGTPPNLRYLNMEYYVALDEIVLGSDTWVVFPLIRKFNPPNSTSETEPEDEGSRNYAIAYKKT